VQCRSFISELEILHRSVRRARERAVPDLTERILRALEVE
jgi:hypothetical protein